MKRIFMLGAIFLLVFALAACLEEDTPGISDDYEGTTAPAVSDNTAPEAASSAGPEDMLQYAAFLELLEENGFPFRETGETDPEDSALSVASRNIRIREISVLNIFEFDSREAMERAAGFICKRGSTIEIPPTDEDGYWQVRKYSWVSTPHWFKQDLIIVLYVGGDTRITDFLAEHLELFAGGQYFWG